MSILVVGLSYRSAPVELLERTLVSPDVAPKLLADLVAGDNVGEALVLATCNRVEVYVDTDKFHAGVAETSELLARHTDVALEDLTPHLYVHYEDRAVAHLFSVACGLDSMVVGESQVLGQVRQSLRVAQEAGTAGRGLNELAQQALRVGKRARTETGIDRAGRSLVSAGLDVAAASLGSLEGRSVLVVGAGSMSSLAASLVGARGARVTIANRTRSRAERVAADMGASGAGLTDLPELLVDADLVVSCTGAVGQVLDAGTVEAAQRRRDHRPLLVLDLALPRDVDPRVRDVEGASLVDLETLAAVLVDHEHSADVDATRAIVADEVAAFLGWQRAARVAPTVVALRRMAEDVVDSELTRLAGRLPELDHRARAEIEQTVHRVVDKVLHAPTVRVKQLAEEPGGQSYAEALRRLFGLDVRAIEAITRADVEDGPR
ncbi:MAG: glutamyl-tRNA reductase [Actinomycetota bacterium]|nr:glutamyl-tRNA reductase [Actinomycetota bacterium]